MEHWGKMDSTKDDPFFGDLRENLFCSDVPFYPPPGPIYIDLQVPRTFNRHENVFVHERFEESCAALLQGPHCRSGTLRASFESIGYYRDRSIRGGTEKEKQILT